MTIYYIGNFKHDFCTEVHLAKTLEDLGHIVFRAQEDELSPGWSSSVTADMVLYTRTWGTSVMLEDINALKAHKVPTVSYHLDLYVGLQREAGLSNDPFWQTDYVFTPDGDPWSAEIFKRYGVNHFYMPPGVYGPECQLIGKPRTKDVCFVGGGSSYMHPEYPYRQQLLGWLQSTYGSSYTKYGYPELTVRGQALNDVYADTKIAIGDTLCRNFTHQRYFSDRIMETVGRGGFIIHPYIRGIEDLFIDGEEIVTYEYGNFEQLKYLINYYLEHDDERETIRKAGHERVLKDHTYSTRMQQMLAVLKEQGAI